MLSLMPLSARLITHVKHCLCDLSCKDVFRTNKMELNCWFVCSVQFVQLNISVKFIFIALFSLQALFQVFVVLGDGGDRRVSGESVCCGIHRLSSQSQLCR